MQNAQRILPRLLCLLLAHGLHTAMASGNGTAGVAAQGTASAEQVAKHSPAGLATSASASVANSSVHSVTFPPAPQPAAQARDCLLKAFNSSTARDKKVFSQWGEDGILESIFNCIGTTTRYYVEFGVQNGTECQSRNLRENHNFTGLLMDGSFHRPEINLQQEIMYSNNIVSLFKKYMVPQAFDQLTVDLDQNTFWIAQSVLHAGYRPRSLTVEFNRNFAWKDSYAALDMPNERWSTKDAVGCPGCQTGTGVIENCYFGASARAWTILCRSYGYHLVAADREGVNLFFVHDTVIGKGELFTLEDAKRLYSGGKELLGLHQPCIRTVWFEVEEGTDFSAPDFGAHLLPLKLLSYKPNAEHQNQRVFYEVLTSEGVLGYQSTTKAGPSRLVVPGGAVVHVTSAFEAASTTAISSKIAEMSSWMVVFMMVASFLAGSALARLKAVVRLSPFAVLGKALPVRHATCAMPKVLGTPCSAENHSSAPREATHVATA